MEGKAIKALEQRVNRLEKVVFGIGQKPKKKVNPEGFTGATGGV